LDWGAKDPCGFFFDALKTPCENNGLEMQMRKFIVGAAAAAMVLGSSVAQAAPVAPVEDIRATSVVQGEDLRGSTLWLGLLAAVLLGLVLWQINDNDGEDNLPTSP
jgi:hypothetical protein